MHGYELKSDHDTLSRLPEQTKAYTAIFDLVTLIVAERHLLRALDVVPDWWGITIARTTPCKLYLRNLKLPTMNPSPDAMSVVKLLWRQEALKLLADTTISYVQSSKPRAWIYSELVAVAEAGYLRAAVRRCLKSRRDWRSGEKRQSCDD
jgi:hypothetical protein